jgi:hypothetical protein
VTGLAQLPKAEPSSEQANDASGSALENENAALEEMLGFAGLALIEAVGPIVSTVHEKLEASPVLPAASLAFTSNVCEPWASPP